MRIRLLPGFATVIGQVNMIHPQIRGRGSPENQVYFLHGFNQTGKSRFGSIGDECQVVLNQAVIVIEVFEHNELFLGKINALGVHIVMYVNIHELGCLA